MRGLVLGLLPLTPACAPVEDRPRELSGDYPRPCAERPNSSPIGMASIVAPQRWPGSDGP